LYIKKAFLAVKIRGKCFKKSKTGVADSSFFQEGRWLELVYENADSCSKVSAVEIRA
jgi:hypothetical protein